MEQTDEIAEQILSKILQAINFDRGVLAADRSPQNVRVREAIFRLMRGCRHPSCAQMSLNRIAAICQTHTATVRHRINSAGGEVCWNFADQVPEVFEKAQTEGADK